VRRRRDCREVGMLTIYCMYKHFRRTGTGNGAALRRAIHVYLYGF
jgi:hypothetical protein